METSEKVLVTGRTLGGDGRPIDGTGFEYAANGEIATAIAARLGPLYANHSDFGEWGVMLVKSAELFRFVTVYREGHLGVPEHIHPRYEEKLELLQGEFRVTLEKHIHVLKAGDTVTIPHGARHGFRFVGKGFGALRVESRPAGRLAEFLPILVGLGQEGKLTKSARPPLLQALAMARELEDDTIYTTPPPVMMRPIARLVGRFGRQANYDRYFTDEFWEQRVEQPRTHE